jgi:hypothetical protein
MSDENPYGLINPYEVQKKVEETRKGLSDTDVKLLRRTAKTDLFYLANTVLSYKDMTEDLHGHLCRWMDTTKYFQYRLVLLPRFHFKTTVVTISDSIQIALPDDTGQLPYPYNLGPNVRIGIAHEAAEHAANFLQSITNHILGNPLLLALFPEILPGQNQRKNKTQLELPRSAYWSEPTFEAFGVGTKSQGRHYNILKPDDIYGVEARDSQTVHKSTIRWIDALPSLTTNIRTDRIDFSGTRYGYDDGYSHIFQAYQEQDLKTYVQSVWKRDAKGNFLRDKDGHYIPIFPERISWKAMQLIMKDRENYETNYLNDPSAGTSEFQESWLCYYDDLEINKYRYERDDKLVEVSLDELDRVMFIDPATTGLSGIVVTGSTSERQFKVLILHEEMEHYGTDDFINRIFQLAARFRVRLIVIEDVLFSVLYQNILEKEMIRRNLRYRVEGAKTRQKMKEDRVRGLTKWFSNCQILLGKKMDNLVRQVRRFPSLKDYHTLDALAYGPEFWRRSAGSDVTDRRQAAMDMLRDKINPVTGYSR